jgi:hypothetical protein
VVLGLEKNIYTGSAILLLSSLLVLLFIYALRVHFRTNANLEFAQKQLEDAQVYQTEQGLCKWEMGRVEEHMKDVFSTLKLYGVIFREQKTKLERIVYIEGVNMKENDYHSKSLLEMRDTKKLIEMIQDFMSIPMSEEGKLSEKSVIYLEQTKMSMNKILTRFYG